MQRGANQPAGMGGVGENGPREERRERAERGRLEGWILPGSHVPPAGTSASLRCSMEQRLAKGVGGGERERRRAKGGGGGGSAGGVVPTSDGDGGRRRWRCWELLGCVVRRERRAR